MSEMSDQLLPEAINEATSERVWTPTVSVVYISVLNKIAHMPAHYVYFC